MSGHSKWSTIKHKKAANDAKRGKLFTRLIKELTSPPGLGGGTPKRIPTLDLRSAIAGAKGANMPVRQHQARDPERDRRAARGPTRK